MKLAQYGSNHPCPNGIHPRIVGEMPHSATPQGRETGAPREMGCGLGPAPHFYLSLVEGDNSGSVEVHHGSMMPLRMAYLTSSVRE